MTWWEFIRLPIRKAGRIALGGAVVAAAAAALGSTFGGSTKRQPAASPEPATPAVLAPVWVDLPDAPPRYLLTDNPFGREPGLYSVRRNAAGGGRLDQLVLGSPGTGGAYLRLTLYRPLDEPVGNVSFWLEMARRAGEAGLALDRAPPVPEVLRTRFGPFEVGALGALGPEGPRTCLGFRHQSQDPDLIISGVACPGDGVDRASAGEALACALEAITLADAGDDPALNAFFKGTEAPACGSGGAGHAGG